MTLITYQGRAAAMAGRERFYLAPHVDQLPDGDPDKTFVCFLVAYAHDVLTGRLPGEPTRYLPRRAERYARECLLPPSAFLARAARDDTELAEHFNVPLEQVAARRAELAAARRHAAPPTRRPGTRTGARRGRREARRRATRRQRVRGSERPS